MLTSRTTQATGILQTVCSVLKTSSAETLAPHMADISRLLSVFSADEDEARDAVDGRDPPAPELSRNSLVAKYRAKMACRMGIKALRPRRRQVRGLKARQLGDPAKNGDADKEDNADEDEEEDVPEELDGYIGKLLDSLQDKDTVVRYSAAKGLARLCTRLPPLFIDQAAQAVTDLFSINVVDFMGKRQDLSNVSEHTWQGACLALAELARRGLLRGDDLGDKLEWVQKVSTKPGNCDCRGRLTRNIAQALVFDVRRGAHSVGTGVRDAACYVLWALARAHDATAIRPYAESLSHQLVCVTLLDRDVSIRRAASAAYQECVGRLGLFAHGIDVIRKTDFFAVSVRRNAFLECAPQVAVHEEYRGPILEHALSTTVFHWDVAMRELGASAVAKIAQIDLGDMAPRIVERMVRSSYPSRLSAKDTDSRWSFSLMEEEKLQLKRHAYPSWLPPHSCRTFCRVQHLWRRRQAREVPSRQLRSSSSGPAHESSHAWEPSCPSGRMSTHRDGLLRPGARF